ncbi:RNA-binding protein 1-like isoform X1 [Ananas comosus]|uniref:RNA-binding protein 1-like isoform X1 n=1 Tax=Ananas comosus TaxID=4615 RepID=A0A6P5H679_ANACO|nr:RNA-binding protein 1-like isoform X1 [Ananas comosus]
MADAYWRYGDARYQAAAMAPAATAPTAAAAATATAAAAGTLKRPRPDYPDMPSGSEVPGYYPREEERAGYRVVRDTDTLGASYDRYLRNGMSSFGPTEAVRPVLGAMPGYPADDRRIAVAGGVDSRTLGYAGVRPEPPLPPDASNTLFVEGLPANVTRREVSHIFRPFVGFREVRLVNKESRHPGGDPLILCFVDFATPAQAAVALDALQGYKFDEHDRESANLRLQFARHPGPRSSGGPRGRR